VDVESQLLTLRWANLLSCLPWVVPATRLILVSRYMRSNGRSRYGWAFGLIGWGVLVLWAGNSLLFGWLLQHDEGVTLWPGILPPLTNIGVGLGVALLTRVSREER